MNTVKAYLTQQTPKRGRLLGNGRG